MEEKLNIYEKVRKVPLEAKKTIGAGRLKGFTDINPMWRIKVLTEQFGVCGIGWYYEVLNKEILEVANEEKIAIVEINLFIKYENEWSKPIFGTGGSKLISKESAGLYNSDECFKMALTDAISVACKSLGIGADVYWDKDKTKYDINENKPNTATKKEEVQLATKTQIDIIKAYEDKEYINKCLEYYKTTIEKISLIQASNIIKKINEKKEANNE